LKLKGDEMVFALWYDFESYTEVWLNICTTHQSSHQTYGNQRKRKAAVIYRVEFREEIMHGDLGKISR